MLYIGTSKPAVVEPVIQRMLASPHARVQQWGGFLAARAGLEFGLGHLLAAARESDAPPIRQGAADLCARSLLYTSDAATATAALQQFLNDEDAEVRKAATEVVAELRNHPLQPFRELLITLVGGPSFTEAMPQLLYTLQAAPDRIDEIVLQCTQRFIDVYGKEAGDTSTSAAGDAQMITQLTLRPTPRRQAEKYAARSLTSSTGFFLSTHTGHLRPWTKQRPAEVTGGWPGCSVLIHGAIARFVAVGRCVAGGGGLRAGAGAFGVVAGVGVCGGRAGGGVPSRGGS